MDYDARRLVFLHYFDHYTAGKDQNRNKFGYKLSRFKFDILAYPNHRFLVAAPAIAKCRSTTAILSLCDSLWHEGRLAYVLSPNYRGDVHRYMNNRIAVLEQNITPQKLEEHYEYQGYTSQRWSTIESAVQLHPNKNHISRVHDCDAVFRSNVASYAEQQLHGLIAQPHSMVDDVIVAIHDFANDKSALFQREIISDLIMKLTGDWVLRRRFSTDIDQLFAEANAYCAGSSLPRADDNLDGVLLSLVSADLRIGAFVKFHDVVNRLSAGAIAALSRTTDWIVFVSALREAYRWIVRELTQNSDEAIKILKRSTTRLFYEKFIIHILSTAILKKILGGLSEQALIGAGVDICNLLHRTLFTVPDGSLLEPEITRPVATMLARKSIEESAFRSVSVSRLNLTIPIEIILEKLAPVISDEVLSKYGRPLRDGFRGVVNQIQKLTDCPENRISYFDRLQEERIVERNLHWLE